MPRASAFDANGAPRSGSKLFFYEPTTTTPKEVYSDSTLSTVISQPVESTSAGLWPTIFMQASTYRVILKDADDVTIWDEDNYDPGLGAGFGVSSVVGIAQGGTGANNAATARANLGAASSSSLSTIQDTVTELQTQVATGLNGDDEFGDLAKEDAVTRALLAASFGSVIVQSVDATPYTANADLTTLIPADDTTPSIAEGTEILTANITPTSSSNKIRITVDGFGYTTGTGTYAIWAIFRGSTCIYVKAQGANSVFIDIATLKIDSPATTSQQTYSVRVSPAGVGVIRMNGNSSGRLFNGVASCTMRLEEIEVH